MSFVHLHCHTEYSLLDGSNKVKEYVRRLKDLGMRAGAITDHGVMYGVVDFYKEATAAGIRPILGCEVYVAPGSRFDKTTGRDDDRYYHLILLAENNTGYANLSHIVSRGFTEGYYYKPRVDMEILQQFHEGIICLSACLAGEIPRAILRGSRDEAREAALRYDACFGHGNFFLELQDHGIPSQAEVNRALLQLSKELDIPLVATNDCHYTYAEDAEAHDILLCIQTGKKVADEDRMRYEGGQYYVKSEEEMRALFPYAQEAVDNTAKIADRCHVELEFGVTRLPHFDVPEGYDSWSYLNRICDEGLRTRYPDDDGAIRKQLDYELSVIRRMGYVDYFLIVWDYIKWAREHDISVGPGRGSAAGSVVSYCMRITNIDPVKYDLLFERFLNPERISMPDIDVDFEYERRQDVINYVTEKYGADRVVQIITFGTLMAKGVIRDVARVMNLPYSFGDQIAKMIPNGQNNQSVSLTRALEINAELRGMYESDPTVHRLIDMCLKLEGLPRHSSTHAAGVVICSLPAEDLIPLSRGADGNITTQFTMTTIEELGLLKMDFLGLRTLTVIKDATRYANRKIGAQKGDPDFIDIDEIDYNDQNVLGLIGSGHAVGIFQLESAGMQSFMKELKPQSLEDIIAGVALYRPGPMDFIPQYIAGKRDAHNVTYPTPALKPILETTYGCIVYQEQVMQIVQQLGGYTLGRADLVRRAMSKKKQHVMEVERANFVYGNAEEGVPGCIARGIPESTANQIYDSMMDFAKYAFNKSHAAAYAVVAMQTAWLKYYYPVEFMAALMTSVIDAPAKVSGYIQTCRSMNISLLPPDINEGGLGFTVVEGGIRYALTAIKSVGYPVVQAIVREREQHGAFHDLNDFLTRILPAGAELNKHGVENLIKAGAFDSLGGTRKQYMCVYSRIIDHLRDNKNTISGQISLFDIAGETEREQYMIRLPEVGEYPRDMLLDFEKDVLGVYISGHPLENDVALLKKHCTASSADFLLDEESGRAALADRQRVTVGGLIAARKIKYTKNDKVMAFLQLEDLSGAIEVIVFPRVYEEASGKLTEDAKVLIEGRVSLEEDQDARLLAERITGFNEIPRTLWIQFPDFTAWQQSERRLMEAIREDTGNDFIGIYLKSSRQYKKLSSRYTVTADAALTKRLGAAFGAENIRVV